MKSFYRFVILLLRWVSKNRRISYLVYNVVQKLNLTEDRRERLEGYIFGRVQLRHLRKGRVPKKRIRNRSKSFGRTVRSFAIKFLVFTLRFFNYVKLSFLTAGVFYLIGKAKFDSESKKSLHRRVYGRENVAPPDAFSTVIRVKEHFTRGPNVEKNTKRLSQHDVIHVFVEQGAVVPKMLAQENLSECQFKFYSFNNISDTVATLGISDRTTYVALRDQFDDLSNDGEDMFKKAKSLAENIVDEISDNGRGFGADFSDKFRESLSLLLDWHLSMRMTLSRCYANAIEKISSNEAIIYVAAGEEYIINGWPFFADFLKSNHAYIYFGGRNKSHIERFEAQLQKAMQAKPPAPSTSSGELELGTFFENWPELEKDFSKASQQFVTDIMNRLDGNKCRLILHGESAPSYKSSLEELGKGMIDDYVKTSEAVPVFLHCVSRAETSVIPLLLKYADTSDMLTFDLLAFNRLIFKHHINSREANKLAEAIFQNFQDDFRYKDYNFSRLFNTTISKFIKTQFLWSYLGYKIGQALADAPELQSITASTTRHWLTRSISAGFLEARNPSVPLIDVQSLNVIRHTKYRSPMSSHATVIDTAAKDLYLDYFNIPEATIALTGALQNDELINSVDDVDVALARKEFGISPDAKVVTIISQLQPLDRMIGILEPISKLAAELDNLHVILRLHPREQLGRKAAYEKRVGHLIRANKLTISTSGSVSKIFAVTDLCTTIYSNMAREAVLLGIPVICAKFENWTPPIQLDKEGLAFGAYIGEDLKNLAQDILFSERNNASKYDIPYLKDNPHLLEGKASERVVSYIESLEDSNLQTPQSTSRTKKTKNLILKDVANAHLVLTTDVRISDLPRIFADKNNLTVYSSEISNERGLLPKNAIVEKGGFRNKTADTTEVAAAQAGSFTWSLIDTILSSFDDAPSTQSYLDFVKKPIWLRLRPRLVRSFQSLANIESGIKAAKGKTLIIGSLDLKMLKYLGDFAQDVLKSKNNIYILTLNPDFTYDLVSWAEFKLPSEPVEDVEPVSIQNSLKNQFKFNKHIERWTAELFKPAPTIYKGPRILLSMDWRLKTVPPTILPILNYPKLKKIRVVTSNLRDPDVELTKEGLRKGSRYYKRNITVVSPLIVQKNYASIPPRALKYITRSAIAKMHEEPYFQSASPMIQQLAEDTINSFIRIFLGETLVWLQYCDAFFKAPNGISVACPGRQWHAEIAHLCAERAGGLSMTIQNAYMTAGYTYTTPTGQYITAIDSWQKGVYMNGYNIEEDKIKIVSTPRFDYLAQLKSNDTQVARAQLGIDDGVKVVFFAAQIGHEDDAEAVIRALANINDVEGDDVIHLVKLHPRTPPEDIKLFQSYADEENSSHKVRVSIEGDIAQYLFASDVVITVYSNVGVEAAILSKNLIIAKFSDAPLPLPLDEFKIGYTASDSDDLNYAVKCFLKSPEFMTKHQEMQSVYRAENPAMVEGNSTAIIGDTIHDAIGNSHGSTALKKRAKRNSAA